MVSLRLNSEYFASKELQLVLTAYHEAGHAVIGLLNFVKTRGISIVPESGSYGSTLFDFVFPTKETPKQLSNALLASNLYLLAAGEIANNVLCEKLGCKKAARLIARGGHDDRLRISKVIKDYKLAEPGRLRKELKAAINNKTRQFVETHWEEIVMLASFLLEHRKASFEDVKTCLLSVRGKKTFWKCRFDMLASDLVKDYNDRLRSAA